MPGENVKNEEQLAWLLEKLTGHESFHRLRGELQNPTSSKVFGNIKKGESRRDGQKKFQVFTEDLILIQSIIAQLERDDWEYALKHLRLALTIPGYLFPGETARIDQTTNLIMYVPDFAKTIEIMRWTKKHRTYTNEDKITEEDLRLLYPLLPSLKSAYIERSQFGKTATQISISLEMAGEKDLMPPRKPAIKMSTHNWFLASSEGFFGISYYGWIVSRDWQKDFLGQLPRSYQDRLTTWHFKIPTAALKENISHNLGNFIEIGFHPAEDHKKWQRRYSSLASEETKEGHGVILWPYRGKAELEEYPEEDILLRTH